MNKQLIAAPLLLSLAGIASAQSSVTLYGIVDAGVTYRSNERVGSPGAYTGHSDVGLTTGNLSGSRWGIKGSEDLGGGMRALFVLENGFDITNGTSGQGGRQFGRVPPHVWQAMVAVVLGVAAISAVVRLLS